MRSKIFLAIWIPYLMNAGYSQSTQQEPQARTRDLAKMFYNDTLPAKSDGKAGAERRVGLKYRILLKTPDCDIRDVDSSHKFRSGDGIRLWFESNVDGFLYVLDKQSSGVETLLFPHPEINNGTNNVERGISYPVPVTAWFIFKGVPGEERLTAIVSKTPLKTVPQLARPQEHGPISIVSGPRGVEPERETPGPGAFPGKSSGLKNPSPAGSIRSHPGDHRDQHQRKQQHRGLHRDPIETSMRVDRNSEAGAGLGGSALPVTQRYRNRANGTDISLNGEGNGQRELASELSGGLALVPGVGIAGQVYRNQSGCQIPASTGAEAKFTLIQRPGVGKPDDHDVKARGRLRRDPRC